MSSANESVVWDPLLDAGLAAGDVVATVYDVTSVHKEEPLTCEPTLKLPAQLKELHVRVGHVQSPSSFYVQLTQNDAQLSRSAHAAQLFKFLSPYTQQKESFGI